MMNIDKKSDQSKTKVQELDEDSLGAATGGAEVFQVARTAPVVRSRVYHGAHQRGSLGHAGTSIRSPFEVSLAPSTRNPLISIPPISTCASPDTMIDTPDGSTAIAELAKGDLVYSVHQHERVAVPVREIGRVAVVNHKVMRIELADGRTLEVSAGHPTADGHLLGDVVVGGELDGSRVLTAHLIPYKHRFTHEILPASDTGTYVANGVLLGSTLFAQPARQVTSELAVSPAPF